MRLIKLRLSFALLRALYEVDQNHYGAFRQLTTPS